MKEFMPSLRPPPVCKECAKDGKKSRILEESKDVSESSYQPYWDSNGHYHNHNPSKLAVNYKCAEGHSWSEEFQGSCQNCDWKG